MEQFTNEGSSSTAGFHSYGITRANLEPKNKDHEVIKGNNSFYHINKPGHSLHEMYVQKFYRCSGCKIKGIGPQYACENVGCNFVLHKDCYMPRKILEHKFFPGGTFVFYASPDDAPTEPCNSCKKKCRKCNNRGRYCNACGMDIYGYFYRAEGYDLHPCCASLPLFCAERGVIMELKGETTNSCGSCGKKTVKVDGNRTDQIWSYVAKDGSCHLHVSCMIEALSDLNGGTVCHKLSRVRDEEQLEIEIAAPVAKKKWEKKFLTIMKYAKIVLGALIAVLFGDPTTLLTNLIVAFTSQ